MIVMKFGGTSLQDAGAIDQVANIVSSETGRVPIVVTSALAGVTDSLLCIAHAALERRLIDARTIIDDLSSRHVAMARELLSGANRVASGNYSLAWVEEDIGNQLNELRGLVDSVSTLAELTSRSQDAIVSFGERLSSLLVAAALRTRGVRSDLFDARRFIITDSKFTCASPDLRETEARTRDILLPATNSSCVPVTQGFIGSTLRGITTTLGRGGSDLSAALIAAALGAEAIEIWTDVDGLMTADPRIVPNAQRIRVISFAEAAELSYFGAKVLHPSTLLPAVERNIPVYIFNTFNPSCEGTLIKTTAGSETVIKSIALKRGITTVNITSTRMLLACGFLHNIFQVFEEHQTSVDVVTTSEVSVSMTLDNTNHLEAIEKELIRRKVGEVAIESKRAIVCLVGDNLMYTPGVAARIFGALKETNIHMISQGSSEINLTLVIDDSDADQVVQSLHKEFFGKSN
jgi:aspartate kinase